MSSFEERRKKKFQKYNLSNIATAFPAYRTPQPYTGKRLGIFNVMMYSMSPMNWGAEITYDEYGCWVDGECPYGPDHRWPSGGIYFIDSLSGVIV